MQYIKIKELEICGVRRPKLTFYGEKLKNYDDIEICSNKRKINYTINQLGEINNFIIYADLANFDRVIKIYIIKGGKKILIHKKNNFIFNRILLKIRISLYRVYKIFIRFTTTILKGTKFLWKEYHFLVPPILWKKYVREFIDKFRFSKDNFYNPMRKLDYEEWLSLNEKKEKYEKFTYNPLISVVIPVYNIGRKYLSECIDSILNQVYVNFEICLADDCSTNSETRQVLKEYEEKDKRVKVVYRKENGHISQASNSALKIAKGEFVAMMDNDDVIPENALYEMVKVLNKDKSIDFIYTDEDKLDLDGRRCDPHFKPDYSPDTLLSNNYLCHFTLLRTSILREIGGWRVGYEGAQDYDLFLRFLEKTNRIYHIPKILYHWRKVPGSTSMSIDNKSYAVERGRLALEDALKRRKIKGDVVLSDKVPIYTINYILKKKYKVSILIPTRDFASTLDKCLQSIYEKTTYSNYEIIILNNNSEKKETFALFDRYTKKHKNFRVIDVNTEFNYSNINNVGVKHAKGDYIVLLNNDTEVLSPDWLEQMLGYASQEHIGTVGVKLLYPDNTVQHAGVIVGAGGVACHAFLNQHREDVGIYGRMAVPYNYAANTAACLMVSKEKYNLVNGLDENLKVAYNDIDFNLKLLEKGYYNVCIPQVELYHFESKTRGLDTTSQKYNRFIEESKYMNNKWEKYIKRDPFYNDNLSKHYCFMLDKKKK